MLRYTLLALFLLTFSKFSIATHIVGGELNYRFINDSTYQLSLKVYRDCFLGVPLFDNPAFINIFDGNDEYIGRINIPRPSWDTLPVIINDSCLVAPPNVCVEGINYSITVRLPVNQTGYQLAYQRCCRNATILNAWDDAVNMPDSSGATYNCFIPPVSQFRNSNPVFTNFPPVAICANRLLDFDHSATDADGDSLVYKLCTPYDGLTAGAPVISLLLEYPPYDTIRWRPPYSLTDMLGGPLPLSIDAKTGKLTAIPGTVGQFVVGICVEEYRKGQFLSTTRRDFQFNVADCATRVRALYNSADTSCNNKTIPFSNQSFGASTFSWNFGDGNVSNAANPTHTYSDYGVYDVMLIANPGAACADTFVKKIYITEDNLIVSADDITACSSEEFVIQLNAQNGIISKVTWLIDGVQVTRSGSSITVQLSQSQQISYTAFSSQGCSYPGDINVNILPLPQADATATPQRILSGQTVSLSTPFVQDYQYQWSPGVLVNPSNQAQATSNPLTNQWYFVQVTDPLTGCKRVDSVFVEVIPCEDTLDISFQTSVTEQCGVQNVLFTATSPLESVDYQWYNGITLLSDKDTTQVKFNSPSTISLTLIASKDGICTDTISVEYTVVFEGTNYFAQDYFLCSDSLLLIDLNIQTDQTYEVVWSHLTQPVLTDDILFQVSSDTVLSFKIILSDGCIIEDQIVIQISDVDISASADQNVVQPGTIVQLEAFPDNDYAFIWQPASVLNNPLIADPLATVQTTTLFFVTATDTFGCTDTASVLVEVEDICDETTLFIPSAFSPNGDGKNDLWRIRGASIEALNVIVYNRWGEKIFETSNVNDSWDGTYNGKIAEGNVFGYYAEVWCKGGLRIERKGNLTLLK